MHFRITGKMRFRELGASSLATISVGGSRNSVLRAQPTGLEGVCVNLPGAVSRQWRKVALASTLMRAGFHPPLTFGLVHTLQPHATPPPLGLCVHSGWHIIVWTPSLTTLCRGVKYGAPGRQHVYLSGHAVSNQGKGRLYSYVCLQYLHSLMTVFPLQEEAEKMSDSFSVSNSFLD